MASSRLDILINAKNNASRELKTVNNDVSALSKSLKGIGIGFAAIGGTAAIAGIASIGIELAKASAISKDVEMSFDSLATSVGASSDKILAALQNASRGTIDNTSLMLAANKAMALGLTSDADQMAAAMDIAVAAAQAFGLDTQEAYNRIITGSAKMRNELLDEIGIVVDSQKAYEDYAASLGKAASDLSGAERQAAFFAEALRAGQEAYAGFSGELSDSQKIETAAAAIENLKDSIGRLLAPGVAEGATALAQALNAIDESLNASETDLLDNMRNQVSALNDELSSLQSGAVPDKKWFEFWEAPAVKIPDTINKINVLEAEIARLEASGFGAADSAAAAAGSLSDMGGAAIGAQTQAEALAASLYNVGSASASAANEAAAAASVLAGVAGSLGSIASQLYATAGAAGAIGKYNELTTAVEGQVSAWQDAGYEMGQIEGVLLPGYLSQQRNITNESLRTAVATGSAGAAASSANKEFSSLQSSVASLLSGLQGDTAGIDADDLLPDPVRLDENARRLADIAVNGFKGQDWLGDFEAEVPDIFAQLQSAADPQAAAAQLLDDFQDGFLNGTDVLINKEAAKDRVKRMLLGEQSAARVAEEIAQEIAAEMGVSIGQAKTAAGAALGTGGGGVGGATGGGKATIKPVIDVTALPPVNLLGKITTVDMSGLELPCIPAKICEEGLLTSIADMRALTVEVWPTLSADAAGGILSALSTQIGASDAITIPVSPTLPEDAASALGTALEAQIGAGEASTFEVNPILPANAGMNLSQVLRSQWENGETAGIEVNPTLPANAAMNMSQMLRSQWENGETVNPAVAPTLAPITSEQFGEYALSMGTALEENSEQFLAVGGGIGTYIGEGLATNFDPYAAVSDMSMSMLNEFSTQNLGQAMALDFAKQVETSASIWEAGGRIGANHAIAGFQAQVMASDLDAVFLSKLAGEVAPLVAAQINGEAMAESATRDGGSSNSDAPPRGTAPSGYTYP